MRKLIISKAVILFSIFVFCVAPYHAAGDIFSNLKEIVSLIKAGNLKEAQTQIEQFKSDYSQDPCLPSALYTIAEQYRLLGEFDEAKSIHQQIIGDYPGSSYANRSLLGISRSDIQSLVASGKHEQAEDALNELVADFSDHQDWPETLYWVGREFGWWNSFEKEKSLYQQIMQNYPGSPFATMAQLDLSRAQVMSLIISEDYDAAQGAYVELVNNFSVHPALPESLHRIGTIWVWSGNNCAAANNIYRKIIQDYPDSSYAEKSQTYLQITQNCIDTFALIESGQEQTAQNTIDRLVTDFNGHELLPHTIFMCGEYYFNKACRKRNAGLEDEAVGDFARAIEVWKIITEDLPDSYTTPEGYYHLAVGYRLIGKYTLAIDNYTRVVEDYPNYRFGWDAQFNIGHSYEKMVNAGLMSESVANPLIASAYQKVLDKYPHCKAAKAAQSWLSRN